MLMSEICSYQEEWRFELKKMVDERVILFGAGNTCEFNLSYFREHGIEPIAFCDNSKEKQGKMVDNLSIISLDEASTKYPDAYYYITTQLYYKEIKSQLLNRGIAENKISEYDVVFQFLWEKDCISYYIENMENVEKFYNSLGDEKSKNVLKNRMLFFRTRNRKYILDIRDKQQYFDKELIDFNYIKCLVDAGMYIGDSILEFLKISDGRYDKIYGFEPDERIYNIAKENLKGNDDIICIWSATSDEDGEIKVKQNFGVMQTIEQGVFGENGNEEMAVFKTCRIDTYFKDADTKIDMLKMDIEGAELASLRGAAEIIKRDKPVLAICVYHKQEDIFEIPSFILGLHKDYKMYLRHYSDNATETVCYFIP